MRSRIKKGKDICLKHESISSYTEHLWRNFCSILTYDFQYMFDDGEARDAIETALEGFEYFSSLHNWIHA